MRKLLTLTLVLTVLLFVTACKANTQATTSTQTSTTQPGTEEPTQSAGNTIVEQMPMYAVSFVQQTEETTDETGKVRFRYSYQNISLVLPESEVADKIILNYLSRMDRADQHAESLLAESLIDEYDNIGVPFMDYITYTPKRFDTVLLSLYANEMEYWGHAAHPNHYSHPVTYDLLTGNVLKLSDVLLEDVTSENITEAVIANLSDTDILWTDYEQIIREMFNIGLDKCENWYFTENGLCFHFDPYILAAYAAGPITVELPYSELVGTLRDEYFPAEQDSYRGNIVVEKFTVDAQNNFTQFAEVILVEEGKKLLLSADGAVTDITIKTEEIASGITTTVMAVQSLTPGDAIMIEFDPETTKLLVSYRSDDQYVIKTITYDQDNISIS